MGNFSNLPINQKKILANLNLANDLHALKLQKKIVGDLFKLYTVGQDSDGFTAPVSDSKALTYQKKFTEINDKINQIIPKAKTQAEQDADNKIINYAAYKRKSSASDFVFKKMSWFHGTRLFSVRLKNVIEKAYLVATNELPKYLPPTLSKGISWLGALYGVNLIVDIVTLANIVFRARRPDELDLSYWQRFKDAMTKERCQRMFNDSLWTITNTLGFALTGGTNILLTVGIVTVASFFLDVVHETTLARLGWRDHELLLKAGENCQTNDNLPQNSIDHINTLIKEKTKAAKSNTIRAAIAFSFVAFAAIPGAILAIPGLFPMFEVLKQPILSLVSSTISFIAGSLFAGLGRKLYLKYKEKYAASKKEAPQLVPSTINNIVALENPPQVVSAAAPASALIRTLDNQTTLSNTVIDLPPMKPSSTDAHLIHTLSKKPQKKFPNDARTFEALDLATLNTLKSSTLTRNPSYVVFPNLLQNPSDSPQIKASQEINELVSNADNLPFADISIEGTDTKPIKNPHAYYNFFTKNFSSKYISEQPTYPSIPSVC